VDGVVAINAVHLNEISAFNYDALLWNKQQIRSVANMTRQDARDFLAVAHQLHIRPQVTYIPLEHANDALMAVKEGRQPGVSHVGSVRSEMLQLARLIVGPLSRDRSAGDLIHPCNST